ncbi:MAG: guanylate kinase [Acutalibacteraceae bacterium]|nr:guanylate kinase [Acutalibacteraceae bacterium]
MNKGKVFIVSGPSGSGKDTILRILLENHPEIKFSVSCVTRKKRGIKAEDEKYNFVSVEEFKQMIENDELLEHNLYVNNYYGTPKKPVMDALNNGQTMIIEVDVNGAFNIKKNLDAVKTVFIMPPSLEELERRLRYRSTDDEQTIQKRIEEAKNEISKSDMYDYVIVNDDANKTAKELYNIINK